jgi:hypothetical protein
MAALGERQLLADCSLLRRAVSGQLLPATKGSNQPKTTLGDNPQPIFFNQADATNVLRASASCGALLLHLQMSVPGRLYENGQVPDRPVGGPESAVDFFKDDRSHDDPRVILGLRTRIRVGYRDATSPAATDEKNAQRHATATALTAASVFSVQ